ncbi:MAG: hemerythrin domain-containing protein [Bacteroidota bacterium]|nr:hemerythrin domain-containing protein [Bacteroidota bacterium]MDP4233229.1 hemerythrin domain-containing protein [Bacteroidota bacterium]MDP4242152.1 hemerythrin domain-containing protein [Bacteroidota bacterium]MDP4287801.1 hemerythrin domain-containing protein [Bacteroidota bacterium]
MQQLYDEHETILVAIDRLKNELRADDPASQAEQLRTLLLFFREYADGYHHQKEDDILFPALADANPAIEMLTGSLEDHHALFRESLAAAEAAINANDWKTTCATFEKYASDLIDHISAENDELFVAAEDVLSDSDRERIHFQFLDTDRELGIERKKQWEEEMSRG